MSIFTLSEIKSFFQWSYYHILSLIEAYPHPVFGAVLLFLFAATLVYAYVYRKEIGKPADILTDSSPAFHESKWMLLFIFLTGLIIRVIFNLTTDAITFGIDAEARFIEARNWYNDPTYIPGELRWLPMHHLLMVALVPLGFSFTASAKIITVLMSVFSIPLFYLLIKRIFNSGTAFWSALLLALNPFHALYSSLFMVADLFLFFVVSSFLLLRLYIDTRRTHYLVLSVVLINAFCMLRYESWVLPFLFGFYLYFKERNLVRSLNYAFQSSISILAYLVISIYTSGVLIQGWAGNAEDVCLEMNSLPPDFNKWDYMMNQLSVEFIFPVWVYCLLIAGVIFAVSKKRNMFFLSVWGAFFSIIAYLMIAGAIGAVWRYLSAPLLMLLPFAAGLLYHFSKMNTHRFRVTLAAVFIFSIPSLLDNYSYRNELSAAPEGYKEACNILKEHLDPTDKIIVQLSIRGFDICSFMHEMDMSDTLIQFVMNDNNRYCNQYDNFEADSLISWLEDTSCHYILVQNGNMLDSIFNSTEIAGYFNDCCISLDTLHDSDDFQLFSIVRDENFLHSNASLIAEVDSSFQ